MSIFLVAGVSLALDALLIYGKRTREDKRAITALISAKKSLIAFTAIQGPGGGAVELPCPFVDALQNYENLADYGGGTGCGTSANAAIGFLPWQAMQLPPLRDGHNVPLWYAVSATCGLQINGAGDYAAVLFAPGRMLSGQTRDPTEDPAPQNAYLDQGNATATADFTLSEVANSGFNDRVLGIPCTEVP